MSLTCALPPPSAPASDARGWPLRLLLQSANSAAGVPLLQRRQLRELRWYWAIGSAAGYWDQYQAGNDPAGITTQDPALASRLDPELAGRRLANYLKVLTLEAQTLARACGKSHVHNLEPQDLAALTVEAAAMAGVPLAGTTWIPGKDETDREND